MTTKSIHVVFGTGAVGATLIDVLHASGEQVRAVNRSGVADVPEGVEVIRGDATSKEFAKTACADASVVYFSLNPPYTSWPELFPPLQSAVIDGAASADAKLVVMENLYMYPPMNGEPLTESIPHTATTRKGTVRAQMAEDLMAADASEIGRASCRERV